MPLVGLRPSHQCPRADSRQAGVSGVETLTKVPPVRQQHAKAAMVGRSLRRAFDVPDEVRSPAGKRVPRAGAWADHERHPRFGKPRALQPKRVVVFVAPFASDRVVRQPVKQLWREVVEHVSPIPSGCDNGRSNKCHLSANINNNKHTTKQTNKQTATKQQQQRKRSRRGSKHDKVVCLFDPSTVHCRPVEHACNTAHFEQVVEHHRLQYAMTSSEERPSA